LVDRTPVEILCRRPDAQRKTNGLSPVSPKVLSIIRNSQHWDKTAQIVRYCQPIVDAIGRIESRDASLADCMLELLCCGTTLAKIYLRVDFGDSLEFSLHAKPSSIKSSLASIPTYISSPSIYILSAAALPSHMRNNLVALSMLAPLL